MKIRFFGLFFKIFTFILLTLQSLVRALRSIKFPSSRDYGWTTPNFVRLSYVIDIANCLNNDVDMTRRKTSKVQKKDKEDNLGTLRLHKEFENLTSRDQLDDILSIHSIAPHKRTLQLSYEEQSNKQSRNASVSKKDLNVEDIIRDIKKSESKSSHSNKDSRLSLKSLEPSTRRFKGEKTESELEKGVKPNNFSLVKPGVCSIPNFTEVWNGIANKRNKELAPVDIYGSHCLAEKGNDFEFQTLVACMLSSQTRDEVTASCMESLKKRGLNLQNILKMEVEELDKLISKVGFHSTKAKNIKKVSQILKEKYNGKVPSDKKELESLPGIGPKMANLILQIAFNKVDGIAVDLHVHRITNRLGWVKTKTPEETANKLQQLIPKNLWNELNPLLVGFGQTLCTAAGPGCPTCPVNKWCPTGISNLKSSI